MKKAQFAPRAGNAAAPACRQNTSTGQQFIESVFFLAAAAVLAGCSAYQPPSGRGYDYDRGRAMARSDVRSGHLAYFVTGYEADRLAALSRRVEANCGFRLKVAPPGGGGDVRARDYARGYNSVAVPVIEARLAAPIGELMQRCAEPAPPVR